MTMPIESAAANNRAKSHVAARRRVLRRATIPGALVTLGVVLALTGDRATADDAGRGRRCSDKTLRGDYGALVSGIRRIPFGPFAGQNEMIVGAGIRSFDGAGGFVDSGGGLHGQLTGVIGAGEEVVGTYTVNPDCTGTSTFYPPVVNAPPVIAAFVVVDSGQRINEAVMQPTPNVVTVVLDRK